jgi:hypothetical protein
LVAKEYVGVNQGHVTKKTLPPPLLSPSFLHFPSICLFETGSVCVTWTGLELLIVLSLSLLNARIDYRHAHFFLSFFFLVLGIELRASHLLSQCSAS